MKAESEQPENYMDINSGHKLVTPNKINYQDSTRNARNLQKNLNEEIKVKDDPNNLMQSDLSEESHFKTERIIFPSNKLNDTSVINSSTLTNEKYIDRYRSSNPNNSSKHNISNSCQKNKSSEPERNSFKNQESDESIMNVRPIANAGSYLWKSTEINDELSNNIGDKTVLHQCHQENTFHDIPSNHGLHLNNGNNLLSIHPSYTQMKDIHAQKQDSNDDSRHNNSGILKHEHKRHKKLTGNQNEELLSQTSSDNSEENLSSGEYHLEKVIHDHTSNHDTHLNIGNHLPLTHPLYNHMKDTHVQNHDSNNESKHNNSEILSIHELPKYDKLIENKNEELPIQNQSYNSCHQLDHPSKHGIHLNFRYHVKLNHSGINNLNNGDEDETIVGEHINGSLKKDILDEECLSGNLECCISSNQCCTENIHLDSPTKHDLNFNVGHHFSITHPSYTHIKDQHVQKHDSNDDTKNIRSGILNVQELPKHDKLTVDYNLDKERNKEKPTPNVSDNAKENVSSSECYNENITHDRLLKHGLHFNIGNHLPLIHPSYTHLKDQHVPKHVSNDDSKHNPSGILNVHELPKHGKSIEEQYEELSINNTEENVLPCKYHYGNIPHNSTTKHGLHCNIGHHLPLIKPSYTHLKDQHVQKHDSLYDTRGSHAGIKNSHENPKHDNLTEDNNLDHFQMSISDEECLPENLKCGLLSNSCYKDHISHSHPSKNSIYFNDEHHLRKIHPSYKHLKDQHPDKHISHDDKTYNHPGTWNIGELTKHDHLMEEKDTKLSTQNISHKSKEKILSFHENNKIENSTKHGIHGIHLHLKDQTFQIHPKYDNLTEDNNLDQKNDEEEDFQMNTLDEEYLSDNLKCGLLSNHSYRENVSTGHPSKNSIYFNDEHHLRIIHPSYRHLKEDRGLKHIKVG